MLLDCHRRPCGNFCNFLQLQCIAIKKNQKQYHSDLSYAGKRKKKYPMGFHNQVEHLKTCEKNA